MLAPSVHSTLLRPPTQPPGSSSASVAASSSTIRSYSRKTLVRPGSRRHLEALSRAGLVCASLVTPSQATIEAPISTTTSAAAGVGSTTRTSRARCTGSLSSLCVGGGEHDGLRRRLNSLLPSTPHSLPLHSHASSSSPSSRSCSGRRLRTSWRWRCSVRAWRGLARLGAVYKSLALSPTCFSCLL